MLPQYSNPKTSSQVDQYGRFERVVYPEHQEKNNTFKDVLIYAFSLLAFGIVVILLNSFYQFSVKFSLDLGKLFYYAVMFSVIGLVALFLFLCFLVFEAANNKTVSALGLSKQKIELNDDNETLEENNEDDDDFDNQVIMIYDEMKAAGNYSKTALSTEIYQKKGPYYDGLLKAILEPSGRQL